MVQIENLPLVLTGLSVTASIIYYASILRNQNKTRQTQLFMQIYQQLSSEDMLKSWAELVAQEVKDYQEFIEKYDSSVNPEHYAKRSKVWYPLNTIGEMLRMGIVDIDLLHRLSLAPLVIVMWERWEHIITGIREHENAPEINEGFEYLYNEMIKHRKQKGYSEWKYPAEKPQ